MNKPHPTYDQVQQVRSQLETVNMQYWLHNNFLSWRWWLLTVVFILLPYLIWWKISDKKRRGELLLYGFFAAICAVIVDEFGTTALWWGYPHKFLPMIPSLFPADVVLVPVFLMIVYQITYSWRSFLIGNVVMGLLMAFVGEPLFIWLGYYQLNSWKLEYSFLFYIVVSILGRWFVIKVISNRNKTEGR